MRTDVLIMLQGSFLQILQAWGAKGAYEKRKYPICTSFL